VIDRRQFFCLWTSQPRLITIDHDILLDHISQDFGIRGTILSWLQSFVTDRLQYVAVGAEQSAPANCTSGVPQGSMLGPLLFATYTSPVGNLISAHNLHHHQYADETQLYMAVQPSVNITYTGISECVANVSTLVPKKRIASQPHED